MSISLTVPCPSVLADPSLGALDLAGFSRDAERASTTYELKSALRRALHGSSVEFFQLVRFKEMQLVESLWHELPATFLDALQKRQSVDALAHRAVLTGIPFSWSAVASNKGSTLTHLNELKWLKIATEHGIKSGMTIAIRGAKDACDVFHFARRTDRAIASDAEELNLYGALAFITSQCLRKLNGGVVHAATSPAPPLSLRELEVVRLCKDGKSYPEIGTILAISVKTVEYHMANVMRKLGVNQKISAIIIAVREGWIYI